MCSYTEDSIYLHMGMNITSERLAPLAAIVSIFPRALTLPQLSALIAVAAEPGLSVNDLAARIEVPQQSASRYAAVLLGRYELPGEAPPIPLLEQRVSEADPRKRALYLTEEGETLLASILAAGWPHTDSNGRAQ